MLDDFTGATFARPTGDEFVIARLPPHGERGSA
jgi:hypothetical protein